MRKLTRNLVLAGMASMPAVLSSVPAMAADASPHTFTTNAAFASDYIFRGLTQTFGKPAVQAGMDYSHAGGLYAGIWGSNISSHQYAGGSMEFDYYFGYNGKLVGDWGWTAGFYGYKYPGATYNDTTSPVAESYDTEEVNVGVSWKWVSLKLSNTLSDFFGANTKTGYTSGSKNSTYLDLTANVPLPNDFTLLLHVGDQDVKTSLSTALASGATNPDYTDYKIGISKAFKDGWTMGLAYTKASNTGYYNNTASVTTSGKQADLGDGTAVFSISRVF
ncbi:MAG TPA: TorF family putative porin [Burkholderiales bacterium]|nr:TorF family putative porin [Burkholderiales bacterium]